MIFDFVKISNFIGTRKDVWLKRLKHCAGTSVRCCKREVFVVGNVIK